MLIFFFLINSKSGIPDIDVNLNNGTIVSPCPPRTIVCIESVEMDNSLERKNLNRAESNIPAIPTIIFLSIPVISLRDQTIASSGFVTQITKAFGEYFFIAFPSSFMIEKLVSTRSSLDIPGFLGIPAVITIA